jgi:hypothetical protein
MTGSTRSGDSPPGPRRERDELVTATGWRLVGQATRLVSDLAAAGVDAPRRDEDLLYAARFQLKPRIGTGVIEPALSVLNAALAATRPDGRPLDRRTDVTHVSDRYHAAQWRVAEAGDRWVGELIWRHPHPTIRGVACTTHAVLSEQPALTRLTVRVGVPGGIPAVYGAVGAGQAHPAFLAELNRVVRLVYGGAAADPRTLEDTDIDSFVRNVLLSEERAYPAAVLAPTEEGEYLVPPAQLAEELLGCAHVYVMARHPTTFRLSDALGDRRLSCYWGALRVYLPAFSCADRPDDHPLLVGERLVDPVVRAQLRGMLGARRNVPIPAGVDALRQPNPPPPAEPAPAAPGQPPAEAPRRKPEELAAAAAASRTAATFPGELRAVSERLGEVARQLERLISLHESLLDEMVGLRTTQAVRGATAAGLERRIGRFEQFLRQQFAPAPAEDAGAAAPEDQEPAEDRSEITVGSVVRQAAVTHADALLILDEAIRSAENSPYEDVDRVALVLEAMALVARRRQGGKLGTSLREGFRELGIEYRGGIGSATSERLRRQYVARMPTGDIVECEEHIVLGASYDPRYCLRIYFTSRAPAEPRFVIAHVGRHFDVPTTT